MTQEPQQRCDNCFKNFPQSKIATHFGYCRRNIKRCSICNEMFDINFKDQHDEEFHRKQKCQYCSKQFNPIDYKNHQKNCDKKPKFCEYCELNVPVADYSNHLKSCESRTKPCTKCNKPIMNKDYIIHLVSCKGVVQPPRQPASYNQHIIQQQKRQQQINNSNQINQISSRQKISNPIIKSKQQKKYVGIIGKNGGQLKNDVRDLNPYQQQKRQSKYPPTSKPQVKPEYVNVKKSTYTNPPINQISYPKKAETKITYGQISQQMHNNPSRQGQRPQISSKELQSHKYSIKQSKFFDKNELQRRQQQSKGIRYSNNQNLNPKQFEKNPASNKIQQKKIQNEIGRKRSPQPQIYQESHDLGDFGLTPQDQLLQQILMQSANQQKTNKSKYGGMRSYKNEQLQLENDEFNQSFIEKQKAIYQQFTKGNRGKR